MRYIIDDRPTNQIRPSRLILSQNHHLRNPLKINRLIFENLKIYAYFLLDAWYLFDAFIC